MKKYNINTVPIDKVVFFTDNMQKGAERTVKRIESDVHKFDSNGIILQKNRDGNWHYNPLRIAAAATQLVMNYQKNPDAETYKAIEKYVDFLEHNTAIVDYNHGFPLYIYDFDFPLHANPKETMYAPWVSGLAQGQVLILISMLDNVFSRSFKEWGNQVFISMIKEPCGKIDKNGRYWIDEYPHPDVFDMTLNGHINGIMGLYYWYLAHNNKLVYEYLQKAIYTVEYYAEQYRNPGHASYYCLAHKVLCDKVDYKYHKCHIKQFAWLYDITGHEFFNDFKEKLIGDMELDIVDKTPITPEEQNTINVIIDFFKKNGNGPNEIWPNMQGVCLGFTVDFFEKNKLTKKVIREIFKMGGYVFNDDFDPFYKIKIAFKKTNEIFNIADMAKDKEKPIAPYIVITESNMVNSKETA